MNKQASDQTAKLSAHGAIDDVVEQAKHKKNFGKSNPGAWLLYGLGVLIAVGLPLLLVQIDAPFVRTMDEVYHPIVLLQLFAFSASVVLTAMLAGKLWQYRKGSWQDLLPFVAGVLVSFHLLALMRHYDERSWDYRCYEEAAQAIVNGNNPYGSCYIYFPTPAQAMALVARMGTWLAESTTSSFAETATRLSADATSWDLLFYFYETTQLLLVIAAFALCYRLARLFGISRLHATGLITVLFLLNNPLLSTLKHNQVNLWVLDLILLAILTIHRYPIVGGLCVAIGAHIKLYPLALLLPWTLRRQWRALFSAGLGIVAIFLLQTNGGRDLTIWRQFLAFADSFPRGTFFRDNSLHSLVYNTLGHLKWVLGDGSFPVNEVYVSRLVLIGMGFLGLIYLWRFVQREQLSMAAPEERDSQNSGPTIIGRWIAQGITQREQPKDQMLYGHMMDALALALITSPVVWEHHYLLAMPIVIWGAAQARNERHLGYIAVSSFLMFVLPTFDIYPFSYHRLAGLLLLMATLSPQALAQAEPTTQQTDVAPQQALSMATRVSSKS